MSARAERWLLAGGLACVALVVLHVVVVFVGAPAYRYFGAGETIARQAGAGSPVPALLTLCIAAVFAVFAWYGLAGAGLAPRPPLMRAGQIAIAAIFLIHGASALPRLIVMARLPEAIPTRYVFFSFASLLVGFCFAIGVVLNWRKAQPRRDEGSSSVGKGPFA